MKKKKIGSSSQKDAVENGGRFNAIFNDPYHQTSNRNISHVLNNQNENIDISTFSNVQQNFGNSSNFPTIARRSTSNIPESFLGHLLSPTN